MYTLSPPSGIGDIFCPPFDTLHTTQDQRLTPSPCPALQRPAYLSTACISTGISTEIDTLFISADNQTRSFVEEEIGVLEEYAHASRNKHI